MNKLIPHLLFDGNCIEAINFYLDTFNGEIEILDKYKDQPVEVDEKFAKLILHGQLDFSFGSFCVSDSIEGQPANKIIWLNTESKEEMDKYVRLLSEGQQAESNQTVHGDYFAEIKDRFNITWKIRMDR